MTRLRFRGLLVLVAAGTLLPAGEVDAQEATLAGYEGSAAASAVHILYQPQNFLPIAPPVDFGAPDALATVATGPVSYGRASVADPGDLLANPEALITLGYPDWPSGTLPPYPFRLEANSSIGDPSAESDALPGFNARVEATTAGSHARATMPAFDVSPVAALGSGFAESSTTFTGDKVEVGSRSEVSDLHVLGLIAIESVVTELSATTDGETTTLEANTELVGATVLGREVIIDANGVRPADAEPGTDPQIDELDEALAAAGITITVAGPVEEESDGPGRLATSGLRIDLEVSAETVPALEALDEVLGPVGLVLDELIPEASLGSLLAGAPGIRHVFAIEVGRGVVSVNASALPTFEFTGPSAPPTRAPSLGSLAPLPADRSPTTTPGRAVAPAETAAPTAPVASSSTPIPVGLGEGIGAIALLVLALQPFLGQRLARATVAVLARQQAATCPREGR